MGALDCVTGDKMKTTESTEVFTINMTASNSCLDVPRRDLEAQDDKSTLSERKHSMWWTLTIDIPLVLLVGTLIGIFELGILSSYKAGFFCNDPALDFPFTGDTVSFAAIVASVILIPVVVIFLTELVFIDSTYLQRSRLYQTAKNTAWLYRSYAYGMFFNLAIVEVMKGITGSPRPTFFSICEPKINGRRCNGTDFVPTFECSNNQYSTWFQTDSYHSFPSGHTSLSVYCGFFCAWYLQKRAFNWRSRTIFVVPVVQMVLLTYSAYCSLTRITDHRHHWWDVTVGTVVGLISLFYGVLVLCDNFAFYKSSDISSEGQQSRTLLFDRTRRDLT